MTLTHIEQKNVEGRHYKSVHEFETQHKAKINSMQLSSSQQFIVTCGAGKKIFLSKVH